MKPLKGGNSSHLICEHTIHGDGWGCSVEEPVTREKLDSRKKISQAHAEPWERHNWRENEGLQKLLSGINKKVFISHY